MRELLGITWDHPRGIDALAAAGRSYELQNGVAVRWRARSLESFEQTPVTALVNDFDLVALDHPFIGDAVQAGALLQLDDILGGREIEQREQDSCGPSAQSYRWQGSVWAGAVDAACMVSALNNVALRGVSGPRSWSEVSILSRSIGADRVLIAANPTHLYGTLLCLCEDLAPNSPRQDDGRPAWWADSGIEPSLLVEAMNRLRELLTLCAPESLELDPITVLERIATEDDIAAYTPLVFGYSTYSTPGPDQGRVTFAEAPSTSGQPVGTLTGGVGLAVSSQSRSATIAADFVRFATDSSVQAKVMAPVGGQVGRRSVALDPEVDRRSGGFYSGTIQTMDRAFLRPRLIGYPSFQRAAASALHAEFRRGQAASDIATTLNGLWRSHAIS